MKADDDNIREWEIKKRTNKVRENNTIIIRRRIIVLLFYDDDNNILEKKKIPIYDLSFSINNPKIEAWHFREH